MCSVSIQKKNIKDIIMQLKTILLISILSFIPIQSIANETTLKVQAYEAMDITVLIEKAKEASPEERTKIEGILREKIAKAHRETDAKG